MNTAKREKGGSVYISAAELDALREALVDKAFVTPKPTLRRRPRSPRLPAAC